MDGVLKLAAVLATVIGVPMLVIMLVGAIGKAINNRGGRHGSDEMAAELEQLRDRVQQLEDRESRVAELEERVDFAERVIAQTNDRQLHG
jgi:hypothetical protein